MADTDDSKII